MKLTTEIHNIQGLSFSAQTREHHQFMDAKKEMGGFDRGPNPKEFVLAGLCGCTGMDVASLLKKFRMTYQSFDVAAETELTTQHPIVFQDIHVFFKLVGEEIQEAQYIKAVDLSMTKYCGVSAMLSKATKIHYHVLLNGNEIKTGMAHFEETQPPIPGQY